MARPVLPSKSPGTTYIYDLLVADSVMPINRRILKNLNVPWVVIVSMDSFYNVLSPEKSALAHAK